MLTYVVINNKMNNQTNKWKLMPLFLALSFAQRTYFIEMTEFYNDVLHSDLLINYLLKAK